MLPTNGQGGALSQLEITPAMIKAGFGVLVSYSSLSEAEASLPLRDVASEVYVAMAAVSRSNCASGKDQ